MGQRARRRSRTSRALRGARLWHGAARSRVPGAYGTAAARVGVRPQHGNGVAPDPITPSHSTEVS